VAPLARRAQGGLTRLSRHRRRAPREARYGDAAPAPRPGGAPVRPAKSEREQTLPRRNEAEAARWLYGRHAVAAALANPARRIRRIAALSESRDWLAGSVNGAKARTPQGLVVATLPRSEFEALLPEGAVHQGVALLADALPEPAIEDITEAQGAAGSAVVLLLDRVTDPHNIGAILRSAAAFGAAAVVIPEHGAPEVTGVLAKAASGALEHVPFLRVVNLVRTMETLKEAGFWCIGLDEEAEKTLAELAPSGRVALVLGSEGGGLRRLVRERCDLLAKLPTQGAIASLNVSNAAAVALYELVRKGPEKAG
jgi:23S rRNA (guanosine2251-2'-O)-methyltransferase